MKLALILITAILLYVLYQFVGYEVGSRMLGGQSSWRDDLPVESV